VPQTVFRATAGASAGGGEESVSVNPNHASAAIGGNRKERS
jgi:hypothetical protein